MIICSISCCVCDRYCAPPNQSDIQLRTGLPKATMSKTDTHVRAIEGEGMFNWRTCHEVALPCPEPLAQFKIQIWNVNWRPDDCIAEAVYVLTYLYIPNFSVMYKLINPVSLLI